MQVQLISHPDHPPSAVRQVTVDLERNRLGGLDLWYMVFCDLEVLRLSPPSPGFRTDRLWKTTCFELFIQKSESYSYAEFNFSPSSDWAAYTFEQYRGDASNVELPHPPIISGRRMEGWYELHVTLPVGGSPARGLLNVTAVIEERDGTKSYWALNHPPDGPPDFHHPACFTLELPPVE